MSYNELPATDLKQLKAELPGLIQEVGAEDVWRAYKPETEDAQKFNEMQNAIRRLGKEGGTTQLIELSAKVLGYIQDDDVREKFGQRLGQGHNARAEILSGELLPMVVAIYRFERAHAAYKEEMIQFLGEHGTSTLDCGVKMPPRTFAVNMAVNGLRKIGCEGITDAELDDDIVMLAHPSMQDVCAVFDKARDSRNAIDKKLLEAEIQEKLGADINRDVAEAKLNPKAAIRAEFKKLDVVSDDSDLARAQSVVRQLREGGRMNVREAINSFEYLQWAMSRFRENGRSELVISIARPVDFPMRYDASAIINMLGEMGKEVQETSRIESRDGRTMIEFLTGFVRVIDELHAYNKGLNLGVENAIWLFGQAQNDSAATVANYISRLCYEWPPNPVCRESPGREVKDKWAQLAVTVYDLTSAEDALSTNTLTTAA